MYWKTKNTSFPKINPRHIFAQKKIKQKYNKTDLTSYRKVVNPCPKHNIVKIKLFFVFFFAAQGLLIGNTRALAEQIVPD